MVNKAPLDSFSQAFKFSQILTISMDIGQCTYTIMDVLHSITHLSLEMKASDKLEGIKGLKGACKETKLF